MRSMTHMGVALPTECVYETIKLLGKDANTLYNCLFVNKTWFKLSASILYSNPCTFFQTQQGKGLDNKRIVHLLRVLYACHYSDRQPSLELEELLQTSTLGELTTNYLSMVKSIDLNSFDLLVNHLLPTDSSQSVNLKLSIILELRVLWKTYRERYAHANLKLLSWNSFFPLSDFTESSNPYTCLRHIHLDWLHADCILHSEELQAICRVAPQLSDLHIRVHHSMGEFTPVLNDFLQNASPNTVRSLVIEGLPLDIESLLTTLFRNHRQSLKHLELIGYNFRSTSLDVLTRFPELSCISLASSRGINDSKLEQISKCTRLVDIDLSKTDTRMSGLAQFLKYGGAKLNSLKLNYLSMNVPKALEMISKYCLELTCLELRRTVYNCHMVPQLILACPQLESLYLGDEVGNPPSSINSMVESIFRSGNQLKYLDLGYCHLTFSVLPLMLLKSGLNIVGPIRCVGVEVNNLSSQNLGSMADTRLKGVTTDVYYDFTEGLELPVAVFPPTFFTKPCYI